MLTPPLSAEFYYVGRHEESINFLHATYSKSGGRHGQNNEKKFPIFLLRGGVGFTLVMKQLVHTTENKIVDNSVEKCITY